MAAADLVRRAPLADRPARDAAGRCSLRASASRSAGRSALLATTLIAGRADLPAGSSCATALLDAPRCSSSARADRGRGARAARRAAHVARARRRAGASPTFDMAAVAALAGLVLVLDDAGRRERTLGRPAAARARARALRRRVRHRARAGAARRARSSAARALGLPAPARRRCRSRARPARRSSRRRSSSSASASPSSRCCTVTTLRNGIDDQAAYGVPARLPRLARRSGGPATPLGVAALDRYRVARAGDDRDAGAARAGQRLDARRARTS